MTCIQIRQTGQLSFSACTLRHSEDGTVIKTQEWAKSNQGLKAFA